MVFGKPILFGMPTLIESPEPERAAALCASLGLDFVELNMNLPQYQPDTISVPQLRRLAEHYGIFYSIHLDGNLNPFDFNPYVSEAYLRTVRETIFMAKELGVRVLNMHLPKGDYFTLPDRRICLYEAYKETYLAAVYLELLRDFSLEDGWAENQQMLALDLQNTALTTAEQKAVAWSISMEYGKPVMRASVQDLRSRGFMTYPSGDGKGTYYWDAGVVLSISENAEKCTETKKTFNLRCYKASLASTAYISCTITMSDGVWGNYKQGHIRMA